LAGVFKDGAMSLYVNGKLAGTVQAPQQAKATVPLSIGAERYPDPAKMQSFFQGVIDEVRISTRARYDRDFTPQARFEADDDTLALYHFDEGQGDLAKDSSGNGHDGKIVGAKWVGARESVGLR
jgi:hypothetical protein